MAFEAVKPLADVFAVADWISKVCALATPGSVINPSAIVAQQADVERSFPRFDMRALRLGLDIFYLQFRIGSNFGLIYGDCQYTPSQQQAEVLNKHAAALLFYINGHGTLHHYSLQLGPPRAAFIIYDSPHFLILWRETLSRSLNHTSWLFESHQLVKPKRLPI